jgi:hypothetical protein
MTILEIDDKIEYMLKFSIYMLTDDVLAVTSWGERFWPA